MTAKSFFLNLTLLIFSYCVSLAFSSYLFYLLSSFNIFLSIFFPYFFPASFLSLFFIPRRTNTHSVPFNLLLAFAPHFPGLQDNIIYSSPMRRMIWGVDEAISLSPPQPLPPLTLLALLFNVSIWRKQTFNQTD